MSNIRQLLSCNQNKSENPFSEADIGWIESVLGLKNGFDKDQLIVLQNLDDLDVEACPGSGKTTVLVAKLALLSRYWIPTSQGICVLSLTNAAREEIQERLGNTVEGRKLLHPPHFIGTIHSFFSDFLAKPYLNSKENPVLRIDGDICRSHRRKTLQRDTYLPLTDHLVSEQVKEKEDVIKSSRRTTGKYRKAQLWLEEHNKKAKSDQRLCVPLYWKMVDDSYNMVRVSYGEELPFDLPESLESLLKECAEEVANNGILDFSDIFVFARALMNSSDDVFHIIRKRFPLLFIDEAQDTPSSQAIIIHDLFLTTASELDKVTRQRFGDANQTIFTFEAPMPPEGLDPFPSRVTTRLPLPVSHRFDTSISVLASRFETCPPDKPMKGIRADQVGGRNHCVIIFNEETRSHVIPTFTEFVAKELPKSELQSANIKVCSHVHKEKDERPSGDDFARTVRDYYSPYVAEKITKEYSQHDHLIDYLRHGRHLVKESKALGAGLAKITEGIVAACMLISDESKRESKETSFLRIKSATNQHRAICREIGNSESAIYSQSIIQYLTNSTSLSEKTWVDHVKLFSNVVNSLMTPVAFEPNSLSFWDWVNDEDLVESKDGKPIADERNNIYVHQLAGRKETLDLKLGTIHSFKGQTHTATLILESTYAGPILGQLKPYIIGKQNSSGATNKKHREWLNALYVGMTRPSHLVCLAIPESHKKVGNQTIDWTTEDLEALKNNGWKVAKVTKNLDLEFV